MSYNDRDLAKFRKRVQSEIKKNPLWVVIANKTRWYCPYCAEEAISRWPQAENAQVELILKHLTSTCSGWRAFKGAYCSAKELRRKQVLRELRTQAKKSLVTKKEWQFTDKNQRWYCPYCVKETKVDIPADRTMNETMLQGIVNHVDGCFEHKKTKGQEQDIGYIQSIVTKGNKKLRIGSEVSEHMEKQTKVWSQRDANGCWICPYCFDVLTRIDITSPLFRRENAPRLIADHLVGLCKDYAIDQAPTMKGAKKSGGGQAGKSPILSAEEEIPVLTSEDKLSPLVEADSEELLSYGGPKPPRRTTGAWGRDGELVAKDHGMTLEAFEKSGMYESIDDSDVTGSLLTVSRESPETLNEWRDEIQSDMKRFDQGPKKKAPVGKMRARQTVNFQRENLTAADLRPSIPGINGYDMAFELCPSESGAHDFIDVFRMGPLFAFALGSITTVSENPVTVAYLARNLLRLHVRDTTDPAEILRLVNADIFPQLGPKTFVSVFIALLDPRPGRLTYSRAGTQAPIYLKSQSQTRTKFQDYEGMVIGADRGAMFDPTVATTQVQIDSGDLLVLHTNGVVECRNRRRQPWGAQRLEHVVAKYGRHEAEYLTDKLKEKVDLFTRTEVPSADVAVLALKRLQNQQAEYSWSG
jgi:hypothetical protein